MSGASRWLSEWRGMAVALACVGAGAVLPAQAAAKPGPTPTKTSDTAAGRLDSSFGKGGKVTVAFPSESAGKVGVTYELPFQFTPGHLEMAQAPGGKLVVAGATKLVRFLANGKLDRGFGSGGAVTVPRPAGQSFVLAAVAVDSQGRTLLVGSARPLPTSSTPDPLISSAAVIRFSADGTVDTGFGSGGMVITDFGFGAPKSGPGVYLGPSVGLRDVAIDSQDRPVLSGGFVSQIGECSRSTDATGFLARLGATGALDPSFGEGGLRPIANLGTFGQLQLTPASGLLAIGSGRPNCSGPEAPAVVLTGFESAGNLDIGFGFSGFRTAPFGSEPALAIAPNGKILLLGRPHARRVGKKLEKAQTLQRLLPSGAADPSFGRVGSFDLLQSKRGSLSALAVDSRGRILLAGRFSRRVSKSPNNPLQRSTFVLLRVSADGRADRSFGKHGSVTTGFGGPSSSFATQVALDAKGRILVGGGISSPELGTGGGFAIARYLSGR